MQLPPYGSLLISLSRVRAFLIMKLIPLTQGYFAKVDDSDFEWLSQWKWRINKVGARIYATRTIETENGRRGLTMHRQILGETDRHIDVDHGDGDQLNNQRYNLRRATRTQNNANQKISVRNSSGYKGVCFCKERRKWVASVASKHIGRFENIEDAAKAYNKAAKELWGEFSRPNDFLYSPPFQDVFLTAFYGFLIIL